MIVSANCVQSLVLQTFKSEPNIFCQIVKKTEKTEKHDFCGNFSF